MLLHVHSFFVCSLIRVFGYSGVLCSIDSLINCVIHWFVHWFTYVCMSLICLSLIFVTSPPYPCLQLFTSSLFHFFASCRLHFFQGCAAPPFDFLTFCSFHGSSIHRFTQSFCDLFIHLLVRVLIRLWLHQLIILSIDNVFIHSSINSIHPLIDLCICLLWFICSSIRILVVPVLPWFIYLSLPFTHSLLYVFTPSSLHFGYSSLLPSSASPILHFLTSSLLAIFTSKHVQSSPLLNFLIFVCFLLFICSSIQSPS